MVRFLEAFIRRTESLIERSGQAVSWLALLLVLVVVYDVFTRYVLSSSSVAVQELEWHVFSILFLLGAAYTLKHDKHVRVDIFLARMSRKQRAAITLLGGVLFLLPFTIVVIVSSWPFVVNSFRILESSPDPGGLPYRFLLKAVIPLGFVFLLLQGVAEILRSMLILGGRMSPEDKDRS